MWFERKSWVWRISQGSNLCKEEEEVWILSSRLIAIWHLWAFPMEWARFAIFPPTPCLQYKYITNATQMWYSPYTNTTCAHRKYNCNWNKYTEQIFHPTVCQREQEGPASCFDEKGPDIGIRHPPPIYHYKWVEGTTCKFNHSQDFISSHLSLPVLVIRKINAPHAGSLGGLVISSARSSFC